MPSSEPSASSGKRILVVDDDPSVRGSVRRILQVDGYDPIEVETHEDALRALADRTPDLVIMDLVLPTMEGRESANLLRARLPELEVLFISGYAREEAMRLGLLPEGEPFLEKPFENWQLLKLVAEILSEK